MVPFLKQLLCFMELPRNGGVDISVSLHCCCSVSIQGRHLSVGRIHFVMTLILGFLFSDKIQSLLSLES